MHVLGLRAMHRAWGFPFWGGGGAPQGGVLMDGSAHLSHSGKKSTTWISNPAYVKQVSDGEFPFS